MLTESQRRGLEKRLGYRVRDHALLDQALTHASFTHAASAPAPPHYDRLEFLGDAVLGLVLAEAAYGAEAEASSGELSRWRALFARRTPLAAAASRLGLSEFVRLSDAERSQGGQSRRRLLADLYESIVGAIYLDGGLDAARAFLHRTLIEPAMASGLGQHDHKSALQERVQAEGPQAPAYEVVEQSGPPHDPVFLVEVRIAGILAGRGVGGSKREAEQAAAREALQRLESENRG